MATMYLVSQLHPSPTNPRKIRDATADAQLLESVKEHGILSSLLVRPRSKAKGGGYEVVLGARRLEAARAANLAEVPAELRQDLNDEQVRELQIVENGQRADVHPLDEADSYKVLVDEYRRDADWIAARVHKTATHVRRRLQLVHLGKDGRSAWLNGHISEDAAFVLSRVPAPLQAHALKYAVEGNTPEQWELEAGAKFDVVSGQNMRDAVRRETMLPIADAPFDAANPLLVANAGSCTACPKRTGTQPALFEDLSASDDLCTDPTCYRGKCDAQWVQVQAEVKASKGKLRILGATETKKLYPYPDSTRVAYGCDWVELDAKARALFTPETTPPIVYAQRPDGVPVTLIAKPDYERGVKAHTKAVSLGNAAAKGAGSSSSSGSSGVSAKQKEKLKAERAAQKKVETIRLFTSRRIMGALVEAAERGNLDNQDEILALVALQLSFVPDAQAGEIAARRGLSLEDAATGKKIDAFEAISRFAASVRCSEVACGLLVELLAGRAAMFAVVEYETLAKAFSVNVAALRSTAEKELDRLAEKTHTKLPGKAAAAPSAKSEGPTGKPAAKKPAKPANGKGKK